MMKKRILLAGALVLAMAVGTGCSSGSKTEAPAPAASEGTAQASQEPASEAGNAGELSYPEKDITVIVPFTAGGNADLSMRALCTAANEGGFFNGHTLVVENVGGGGAVIGQTQAFEAEKDGYTLMLYTSSVINNDIFNETEYRYNDFLPIAGYNPDPEVIFCPANAPYDTLEEFYEWAAGQETVLAATPGHTTGHHIRLMNMAEDHQFNFDYIHTDGAADQLLQVMGGHVDISMNTVGATKSAYEDGTIKILAAMSEERVAGMEDVPTFRELGEELIDGADRGICVVKGVDDAIYQYLVEEFKKVIETDAFVKNMETINGIGMYKTPEQYQSYMDNTYNSIKDILPKLEEEASN